jgi:ketosteroid isomerase-like protein
VGNEEIVRQIYEEGLVDPGIRRGRAEFILALRRARQMSASYRHELHELYDGGDILVAAVTRHAGSVMQDEAHTWTFREGKVVRLERSLNLDAALEAAGLRE